MDAQSLTSDEGIACQTLFIQFYNTLFFLLDNTNINNHGITEDEFFQTKSIFSKFLECIYDELQCAYMEFVTGTLSLAQFTTLFVDYHQNVLLLLTEMYGDSIDWTDIDESNNDLQIKYGYVMLYLTSIEKFNQISHYNSLKDAFEAYLQISDDVIENITKINPQDQQVNDSRCMDLDNSNNNNGDDMVIVVVDEKTEKNQKILAFFKEHLFKRANSVIKLYKTANKGDQQILCEQFNLCYETFFEEVHGYDDDLIGPQGEVTRNSSLEFIGDSFNRFLYGVEDKKELEEWR
ncbi:hypothetical protein H4219_006073 [Mycoemilia scoparia]|uniref:Uncharacterized protein n=1 Tax=Mycoemilia scoparia TaxID=417184 RepID=A0A9W7ZK18_9FUNG|nr:hypothetical protein H4219_006073 [Mycoemilia scoparia]